MSCFRVFMPGKAPVICAYTQHEAADKARTLYPGLRVRRVEYLHPRKGKHPSDRLIYEPGLPRSMLDRLLNG